jgi:hypothetical protein
MGPPQIGRLLYLPGGEVARAQRDRVGREGLPHPAAFGGDPPLKGREERAYKAAAAGSGFACPVRSALINAASRNARSSDCSALSRGSQNV